VGSDLVRAQTTGAVAPGAVAPIADIAGIAGKAVDRYFSYRVGVQYDLTADVMAYATYAKGFKGSAVNDQAAGPGVPTLVKPEIPHASEIGVKSTLFEGRLGANLALFYTKIDDFQAQFFDPALAEFIFGNAPSLTTKGVEASVFGKPAPGVTLNLGGVYDDARYGPGYLVSCAQLQTVAQGCVPVLGSGGTPVGTITDAGGARLVGAPEWKVTASGEYARSLANNLTGYVQVDLVYTSQINWDAAYDPIDTSAPAAIVGGRIGVRTDDQRFGVALFVRNLFDVYRPIARFATPAAPQELDPQSYSQIAGPESRRLIGVSLDARF
jgi:iron complex outermembrane receptor protein